MGTLPVSLSGSKASLCHPLGHDANPSPSMGAETPRPPGHVVTKDQALMAPSAQPTWSPKPGGWGHGAWAPGSAQRACEPPAQSLTSEGPAATSGPGHLPAARLPRAPGRALPSGRALGFWSPPSSISSKAKDTLWTCKGMGLTFPARPLPPLSSERTDGSKCGQSGP